MSQIFLCWNSPDDDDIARQVMQRLRVEGHIISTGNLPDGGWGYTERILEADCVIGLVSKTNQGRHVFQEILMAFSHYKKNGFPWVFLAIKEGWLGPPFLDDSIFDNLDITMIAATDVTMYVNEFMDKFKKAFGSKNVDIELSRSKYRKRQEEKMQIQARIEEEKMQIQARIEEGAPNYIRESLNRLAKRENFFKRISIVWSTVGALSLISGVAATIWRATLINPASVTPASIGGLVVIGVTIIGLLIAIAKYSFAFSQAYMAEALRISDRSHAISFGEFYLKAFGRSCEWQQVKDVFQHWNIDKGSVFFEQKAANFDPRIIQNLTKLVESITSTIVNKGKAKG